LSRIFKRPDSPNWYYTNGSRSDRKRSTGTSSKKTAKLLQAKWDEEAILLKHNVISHKISLKDASIQYKELIEGKVGRSYYNKVIFITGKFSDDRMMHEITVNDIDQFINSRKVSPKTIRDNVSLLHKWFEWGRKRNYCAINPVDGAILPPLVKSKIRNDLNPDDVMDAINSTVRTDDKMFWSILYYTGLRALDGGTLTKDNISKGKDGKPIIDLIQGKTKRRVIIPLHHALIGKDIYNVMTTYSKYSKSRVRLKNFIPESDLHSLRHTFASQLSKFGATNYEVKYMLGHKSNDITTEYIHHSIDRLRGFIDRL